MSFVQFASLYILGVCVFLAIPYSLAVITSPKAATPEKRIAQVFLATLLALVVLGACGVFG